MLTRALAVTLLAAAAAVLFAAAGCRNLPPSKPESEFTPQEASGQAVYRQHCERCHYPTSTRGKNGPGLQALTKLKSMPSGAPPTDERLTDGHPARTRHDAGHAARRPAAPRSAGLPAHAMSQEDEPKKPLRGNMPLPGVLAIALYLMLLSATIVAGVVGRHYAAHLPGVCRCFCQRQRRAYCGIPLGVGAGAIGRVPAHVL